MGNEIYHMNVYAMSTVVSATKTDIDNLLRTFEGLEKKYPHYEKKCRDLVYRQFALFPVKDNPTDEEFYAQSLDTFLYKRKYSIHVCGSMCGWISRSFPS